MELAYTHRGATRRRCKRPLHTSVSRCARVRTGEAGRGGEERRAPACATCSWMFLVTGGAHPHTDKANTRGARDEGGGDASGAPRPRATRRQCTALPRLQHHAPRDPEGPVRPSRGGGRARRRRALLMPSTGARSHRPLPRQRGALRSVEATRDLRVRQTPTHVCVRLVPSTPPNVFKSAGQHRSTQATSKSTHTHMCAHTHAEACFVRFFI